MTAYFVLRTPSGPVRFRVNTEARDYEAVLVREEDMDAGLLLFALVDAVLEADIDRCAYNSDVSFDVKRAQQWAWRMHDQKSRLGQWRALWWG